MNLVNEDSAANFLGASVRSLQQWRVRGCGPKFIKIGRLVRYSPDDLKEWIESRRRQSTSE